MKFAPPNRALKFLRWFCREDYLEEIEGDLVEIFEMKSEDSPKKASRQFMWNVIKYFRPAFIKSFRSYYQQNTIAMFRHNMLITFRNFNRYRSSFLINLTGMSVGLASVILIFLWVTDELSIDKYHEKDESLYQVMHNIPQLDGIYTCEYTPGLLAETISEQFPEVQYATAVVPPSWFSSKGIISHEQTRFKAGAQYIGKEYFSIFSCDFINGSKKQLIENKHAIAISEELAKKLFGSAQDGLDKMIHWEKKNLSGEFNVVGVFSSPPANSTEQYEILFNYDVFLEARSFLRDWGNSDPYTYLVLNEGVDNEEFNTKITSLLHSKRQEPDHNLFVRKYSDQHLYNRFENGKQAGGRIEYVRLFGIVAVFILVIACVNFMNLATAKVSIRLKEIGVKKTFGINRKSLIFQFLSESIILTIMSLLVALLIVILFLPHFNHITGKELSFVLNKTLILGLAAIVIITGMVSGSYPAFYLSAIKPIRILNGDSTKKRNANAGELLTRKGLVIFQFALSIVFITSVIVIHSQMNYVMTKNLGYDQDNLLHFDLPLTPKNDKGSKDDMNSKVDVFLNEIHSIPGVLSAFNYYHDLIGYHGVLSGVDWKEGDEDDQVDFRNLEMGYDFIQTMGIELHEGRTFSQDRSNERSKVMFNEEAIRIMNLEDPVGKIIRLWGREREIIGVVSDFHLESLHERIKPCVIQLNPEARNIMVKIQSEKLKEATASIQSLYMTYCPGLPFEYKFIDQDFASVYASEQRVGSLSKYFAAIAILISCLGLFGLTSYSAEQRTKEIGIRKVLGASAAKVVRLLVGDFIFPLLIAFLFAVPVSWFLLNRWLEKFAFHTEISWWTFGLAGMLIIIISLLTIGFKTIKAANMNPVDSLRNE